MTPGESSSNLICKEGCVRIYRLNEAPKISSIKIWEQEFLMMRRNIKDFVVVELNNVTTRQLEIDDKRIGNNNEAPFSFFRCSEDLLYEKTY